MASNIKSGRIKLFQSLLDSARVNSSVFACSFTHNLYRAVEQHGESLKAMLESGLIMYLKGRTVPIYHVNWAF